jgi:hypothetical protein
MDDITARIRGRRSRGKSSRVSVALVADLVGQHGAAGAGAAVHFDSEPLESAVLVGKLHGWPLRALELPAVHAAPA